MKLDSVFADILKEDEPIDLEIDGIVSSVKKSIVN